MHSTNICQAPPTSGPRSGKNCKSDIDLALKKLKDE